ncbi:response regulator [Mariprofundus sp. KV]|uniref:response regulator n=1 Tax=Mariprofundus sp. KV TaxID=2608715 RepID=UPI0015A15860|nr:response regulator [Mariprofundus sp. KV]NWF36937.1 response regulator [Mariprofundus sp. KV]
MNIFIVDDNPHISELLAFLLSDIGHQVHAFEHPEHALSHMREKNIKPHILITDYNMPGMNGYELHQQTFEHAPQVNTIVMSGRPVDRDIGGLHFIQKPFNPESIIALVETFKPA